jgi:hypothetical protein
VRGWGPIRRGNQGGRVTDLTQHLRGVELGGMVVRGGQIQRWCGRTQVIQEESDDRWGKTISYAWRGAKATQCGGAFLRWRQELGMVSAEHTGLLGQVRKAAAREGVGWHGGLGWLG